MSSGLPTYWICVAHRWAVPPINCGAHGNGDRTAAAHTEKDPHHPTVTTTSRELAERLAQPQEVS